MAVQYRSADPYFPQPLRRAAHGSLSLVVQPAMAQSILRDAETEALLEDMSAPLIAAAGLDARTMSRSC